MSEPARLPTAITRLLGIDPPVLLAPMGGVAGGALAGAVSSAGGLGLIGAGYAAPALGFGSDGWIRDEFVKAGNRAVGIGFITWALDRRPAASQVAIFEDRRGGSREPFPSGRWGLSSGTESFVPGWRIDNDVRGGRKPGHARFAFPLDLP